MNLRTTASGLDWARTAGSTAGLSSHLVVPFS
jgi:hypothetical protein